MSTLCEHISPHHTSHIIASHQTSDITSHHITHYKPKEENTEKCTRSTTKNEHHTEKFLGRMCQNSDKYENSHEKSTSVLRPNVAEHRKVRELPRKMNIQEVAPSKTAKKYEFFHENPVQEHPRRTKSTRITMKNEHRRI